MSGSRLGGLLLTLALAAPLASAQSAKLAEKDVASIKAANEAFMKGVLAGDFAAVASHYTESATFLPPNEKLVTGRAGIQAWMGGLPPLKDFKLTPVEIDGRGDLAFVRGTFTMTLLPPGAPAAVTDVGKYVEVRRRQADGSWLISLDMFNSDLPPAK